MQKRHISENKFNIRRKRKNENKKNNLALAKIKTNIQNRGQHCYTALSAFQLVPRKYYKPVLQYLCKLDFAEAVFKSTISLQKYSIVSKGPSND